MINNFKNENFFLSNFYKSKITDVDFPEITYPTVEHAFQAAKTNDITERKKISLAATPDAAKHMGRHVNLRSDWETVKNDYMYKYVKQKFSNVELKEKILHTKDEELIEGNYWHDNYWGSCSCSKCKNNGKNNLGKILMEVRKNMKGGAL